MLKSFVGVLASQTKLYRVKQGREAHEVISTIGMFSEMHLSYVYRARLPATYHDGRLLLIARHSLDIYQARLSLHLVVILLIGIETSPISCFYNQGDQQRLWLQVNLQSLIPTSFYITVANWCENDAGMRLCKFTLTIVSSLPCLHTFWHAIPTSLHIIFKSSECQVVVLFLLHYIANDPSTAFHDTWWSRDENSVDESLSLYLSVVNTIMCGTSRAPTSTVVRIVV